MPLKIKDDLCIILKLHYSLIHENYFYIGAYFKIRINQQDKSRNLLGTRSAILDIL